MQLRSRKTTKSSTTSCCAIWTSRFISSTFRNWPLEGATTSERTRTTPTPQELTFSTTKTAILSGFAHTQFQVLELHSYTLSTDLFIINSMGPGPSVSRPQPCVEGPWLGTTVGYAGVVSFILFHIIIFIWIWFQSRSIYPSLWSFSPVSFLLPLSHFSIYVTSPLSVRFRYLLPSCGSFVFASFHGHFFWWRGRHHKRGGHMEYRASPSPPSSCDITWLPYIDRLVVDRSIHSSLS